MVKAGAVETFGSGGRADLFRYALHPVLVATAGSKR
jgi:hypothetical protein